MNNRQKLLSLAKDAFTRAYAPYSRFAVGAAVLTAEGRMYAGCNVENVSYPNGTCAETGAIAAMVAGGDRKIVEIVIVADGQNLITPCGACRQRLKEFAVPGMLVHLADVNGIRQTITLEELLPFSFTDESLRHD